MPNYAEVVSQVQDQVIAAVKQTQDITVSAVAQVAETVAGLLPELPALPFAEQIPAPKDVVTKAYAFAGALLDARRDFALRLIEAVAPVTPKVNGSVA